MWEPLLFLVSWLVSLGGSQLGVLPVLSDAIRDHTVSHLGLQIPLSHSMPQSLVLPKLCES